MDILLFLLVLTGWEEPPPPLPICVVGAVYLYHPMGSVVQPALKKCTDEPCVTFPLKRRFIKENSFYSK